MRGLSASSRNVCLTSIICAVLLASLLLSPANAQSGADIVRIRVEGPSDAPAGSEVILKAFPASSAASEALEDGAVFEWVINDSSRSQGDQLRCRSRRSGKYNIELQLVTEDENGKLVFAKTQHTLVFEGTPEYPPESPSRAARERKIREPAWNLIDTRELSEESIAHFGTKSVTLEGNRFKGVTYEPCVGEMISTVSWPTMPESLAPGALFSLELIQELELRIDTDPACGPLEEPLSSSTSCRFIITSSTRHEQTVDSLPGTAREPVDRFHKSKIVEWRIPTGRPGETLTIEVGGECEAGKGVRYYTYKYEAPDATSAAKPSGPLVVQLRTSAKKEVFLGSEVLVRAVLRGGRPPYSYTWTAYGERIGQNRPTLTETLRRPGECRVNLGIVDADGTRGSAQIVFEVLAPSVRISKISPPGRRIYLEEKGVFKAEAYGAPVSITDDYAFRWQSTREAGFTPAESTEPETEAQFFQPGAAEVTAELVYRTDKGPLVVGTSDSIPLEVVPPDLKITLNPIQPRVGETARASLSLSPSLEEIEFKWLSVSDNMNVLSRTRDNMEIRFRLTDNLPGEARAAAYLPRFGTTRSPWTTFRASGTPPRAWCRLTTSMPSDNPLRSTPA